jgi:glutathione S-transferase
MIFEELGLPYETKYIEFPDMKKVDHFPILPPLAKPHVGLTTLPFQAPYNTEINPNGRVPAIIDPNTNITLWESGAIAQYLVETYDQAQRISYHSSPEKYLCIQWLHFQTSGQGPYFGQAAWFQRFHAEKLPSAIERYVREVERVISVMDAHLRSQGTDYLVGDKCTYADMAFVPWGQTVPFLTKGGESGISLDLEARYPSYDAWMKRVCAKESVKKVLEEKAKLAVGK